MRTTTENGKITIYLEGRINTDNAANVEAEVLSIISEQKPGQELIFDAEKLEYISSAGLRVLMKVRKELGKAITITEVNRDVYDIFETTGFSDLFNVKRVLRKVSIEGCEKLGGAPNCEVYRLDRETIVKVYKGDLYTREKIEKNKELAKKIFTGGISTVIPFDMVKVGAHYGLVFEMMSGDSLANILSSHPEETEKYGKKVAGFIKKLHSTEFEPGILPDASVPYIRSLKYLDEIGIFSSEETERVHELLRNIPHRNTFIHQNLNPINIMLMDDEFVLIDVDDSGTGHPVWDLMGMYQVYINGAKAGWTKPMMGLGEDVLKPLWTTILHTYLGDEHSDDIPEVNRVLGGYTKMNQIIEMATNPTIPGEIRKPTIEKEKAAFFDMIDTLYPVPRWI